MQTLSAYLLETVEISDASERARAVSSEIDEWLRKKGAGEPAVANGTFESKTVGGNGRFTRERLEGERGFSDEVRLEEFSRAGQTFTTRLTNAVWDHRLYVYCTLSVANTVSVVAPITTDPRCPSIVRTLLGKFSDWSLNGMHISSAEPIECVGEDGAKQLADQINARSRSLPIVVVSELEGEPIWQDLVKELAFDLAGLAQVVRIDDEATWTLSEEIGKINSCYMGAVRLYWPPKVKMDGSIQLNSTVWTASALLSSDKDGRGLNRLRSTLRRMVMSTAALTITPPRAIREIQDAVARKRLGELEARATTHSEELEMARLYVDENQELKAQIDQLREDLARVSSRAESAEHGLHQLKQADLDDSEEGADAPVDSDEVLPPQAGEVRFYKKTHSKAAYDVLVRVKDCGHTSWQSSAKADKARKGVERLEKRTDWKNMQHCGTCTNGGMWKVRW
jgi:hypothetical protein